MRCAASRSAIHSSSRPLASSTRPRSDGLADDRLKLRAGNDCIGYAGIEDFTVAAVAEDEPVVDVIKGEALGDALDRIDQPLARFGHLAQVLVLDLDGGVAEKPERLGHAADLVAACEGQRRPEVAAGDGEHAVAQPRQAGEQAAVDIQPDDQNRTQQAEKSRAKHDPGTVALDGRGLATAFGNLTVGRSDEAVHGER